MMIKFVLTVAFILIPIAAIANTAEQNRVQLFEERLKYVEEKIDQVNSPIQQLGPSAAERFDSLLEDLQMSSDEIGERLSIINFILKHKSAPEEKKVLARTELSYIEADLRQLEKESALLSKKINYVTQYY